MAQVLCPLQAGIVPYPGTHVIITSTVGKIGGQRIVWVHSRFTKIEWLNSHSRAAHP